MSSSKLFVLLRIPVLIRPCHTVATLSRETKKALFYHAKPHPHGFDCEAWRGKTKLFWSPGTIWPPCDKGEFFGHLSFNRNNIQTAVTNMTKQRMF